MPSVDTPMGLVASPAVLPKRKKKRFIRAQVAECARDLVDQLLEFVGPSSGEVDEVVHIIISARQRGAPLHELNARLRPHSVQFTDDNPYLGSTSAAGGCYGTNVVLPVSLYSNLDTDAHATSRLRTLIAHELTHRDQMCRAEQAGADPEAVTDRIFARIAPGGKVDHERYSKEPLEMQALARNAVDSAARDYRSSPDSLRKDMRSGRISSYAPSRVGDRKRFLKNTYNYAKTL